MKAVGAMRAIRVLPVVTCLVVGGVVKILLAVALAICGVGVESAVRVVTIALARAIGIEGVAAMRAIGGNPVVADYGPRTVVVED